MRHIIYQIVSLLLILSVALLSAACGETESAKKTKKKTERTTAADKAEPDDNGLQEKLEEKMKEYNFSGVLRVSKNGKVLCEGANGVFSADSGEPITLDNIFPIASVSKQFCATCILLLRDEGKLSLDDTLDKYYPEFAAAEDITLKEMLSMRSGIPDYVSNGAAFDSYIDYDFSDKATEKGNHQAVRDWIFDQPLLFEPGTEFSYSDSNFFLLAEIVEKLSGKPYGDVLRERIFKPLGMNDTGVCEELAHSERTVPPVSNMEGEDGPMEIYTIGATYGNGGVITSAADMDKWLTSLREYTILSEDQIKEMTTDYNGGMGYGYGICIDPDGSLWHDGSCDSFASYAYTHPDEEYNFFVVTSYADSGFGSLIYDIMGETM